MSTKIQLSAEELRACAVRMLALDADGIAENYRNTWNRAPHGTYVYLRVNPRTGETWTHISIGEEYGTDEYFSEHGAASITTLISSQRDSWEPGPDEGFEWEYEDQRPQQTEWPYWRDTDGSYCCTERLAEALEYEDEDEDEAIVQTEARKRGWIPFDVGYTPVDSFTADADADAIRESLNHLVDAIRDEIADQE